MAAANAKSSSYDYLIKLLLIGDSGTNMNDDPSSIVLISRCR